MRKDPRVHLNHIAECAERILEYTEAGEASFESDKKTQDAVIRNLEVIGEAAKRIPEDFRSDYPAINWKGFAGMRDILIHQYEGVDLGQVWRVVQTVIPSVLQEARRVVPDPMALERELSGGSE